jgi:DNA-binding MarR family transcriptional regulator
MSSKNENSEQLAQLWHKIMISGDIVVCTEKLKGASIIDVNILRLLEENETMILKDIGTKLSVSPSTLSSAIKRMEKSGLIERVICKEDLRSYFIIMTDYGKLAINEHYEMELKIMDMLLGRLDSENERKEFLKMLKKLIG